MVHLVHDHDYKVRAAAARTTGHSPAPWAQALARILIADSNWHVRECLLRGMITGRNNAHDGVIVRASETDPSWRDAPISVRTALERFLLLGGHPSVHSDAAAGSNARERALFGLLREHHTGRRPLPQNLTHALLEQARKSGSWLLGHQVALAQAPDAIGRLADQGSRTDSPGGEGWPPDPRQARETYRRLRDHRHVQVALDLHDLTSAIRIAEAAAAASVAFLEVGDPLIKTAGVQAIGQIKRHAPNVAVVAEMMSADWGRDQVILAAEAGADVVMLIGCASTANVTAAVDAGAGLGIPILLDVPASQVNRAWIHDMEHIGVDGFAITTNIDLGVASIQPLARAKAIRSWTRLPVAVSGGFSTTDRLCLRNPDWDILIVGRAITEAVAPMTAIRQLVDLIEPRSTPRSQP